MEKNCRHIMHLMRLDVDGPVSTVTLRSDIVTAACVRFCAGDADQVT